MFFIQIIIFNISVRLNNFISELLAFFIYSHWKYAIIRSVFFFVFLNKAFLTNFLRILVSHWSVWKTRNELLCILVSHWSVWKSRQLVSVVYWGTMLDTALTNESGFRPIRRKVVILSLPLTKIDPRSSNVYHSLRTCMHLSGTWIRPCTPVESILEAMLTESPQIS